MNELGSESSIVAKDHLPSLSLRYDQWPACSSSAIDCSKVLD